MENKIRLHFQCVVRPNKFHLLPLLSVTFDRGTGVMDVEFGIAFVALRMIACKVRPVTQEAVDRTRDIADVIINKLEEQLRVAKSLKELNEKFTPESGEDSE